MHYSPFRYPGGKNKLAPFIAKICHENNINGCYIEPYSGGASVALFLLLEGYVKKIIINDKDRSIYAVWHSILNKTNKFCKLIEEAEFSIEEWRKQKAIQENKKNIDLLNLGFSTFYLNRTNRSGIISAGVIGGNKQEGNYLMNCRFNKEELIKKIRLIASYKKQIKIYKKDAIKLIEKVQNDYKNNNFLIYLDPPYFLKAESLYLNYYLYKDHKKVSQKIETLQNCNWVISYDNVEEIKELYKNFRKKEFTFNHSAYNSRQGKEILFFSDNLLIPSLENLNPVNFKIYKTKDKKEIIYITA